MSCSVVYGGIGTAAAYSACLDIKESPGSSAVLFPSCSISGRGGNLGEMETRCWQDASMRGINKGI